MVTYVKRQQPLSLFILVFCLFKFFFSDRSINPGTIESRLLVPALLKEEFLSKIVVDQYTSEMGEGNKPETTTIILVMKGSREAIEERLKVFFTQKGFKQNPQYAFRFEKENDEIEYLIESIGEGRWHVKISLFYY